MKEKALKEDNAFAIVPHREIPFGEREKGNAKDITSSADLAKPKGSSEIRFRQPLSAAANDCLFWWLKKAVVFFQDATAVFFLREL